jgi:hypothetical protein
MASFVVLLEDGHVPGCADHEENHEDGGNRNIDALLRCATERPCRWKVRTAVFLLCAVRDVDVGRVYRHTICEVMMVGCKHPSQVIAPMWAAVGVLWWFAFQG